MPAKQNLDFLSKLGTDDKGDNIKLSATEKLLIDLAADFALNAKENLNKAVSVSSGGTLDSIKPLNPIKKGKTIRVEVEVAEHYDYLNSGVKGTKGGAGKYGFKNDKPSRKMVAAIERWAKKEGLKVTDNSKNKVAISKREGKRQKNMNKTVNAYGIARAVKQKGIKANRFWDKATKQLEKDIAEKAGAALKIDILNSF